jgi:hypothetical protein
MKTKPLSAIAQTMPEGRFVIVTVKDGYDRVARRTGNEVSILRDFWREDPIPVDRIAGWREVIQ